MAFTSGACIFKKTHAQHIFTHSHAHAYENALARTHTYKHTRPSIGYHKINRHISQHFHYKKPSPTDLVIHYNTESHVPFLNVKMSPTINLQTL